MTFNILIPQGFGRVDGRQALEEILNQSKKGEVNLAVPENGGPFSVRGAQILTGDLARTVHRQVMEKYGEHKVIKIVDERSDPSSGLIVAANPFYMVAANQFLKQAGYRIARHEEMDKIYRENIVDLNKISVYTGLLWHSTENAAGTGIDIAKNLKSQFESKRDIKLEENKAYIISLDGLKLAVDDDSQYGLSFVLGKETVAHRVPGLDESEDIFKDEFLDDLKYPTQTFKQGTPGRFIVAREKGLSMWGSGSGGVFFSFPMDPDGLASDENRMVVVEYITQLEEVKKK